MITKEAKQFIDRFVSGEFTPGEHEIFLRWLEQATAEDLEAIADEYEALEGLFDGASQAGPSAAWVEQLERKLDLADRSDGDEAGKGLVRRMWPGRNVRRAVGVAAAIAVVSAGIYKLNSHTSESVRSGAPGSFQQLSEVLSYNVGRGKPMEMKTLPDGSQIWLNAASSLKYPRSFSGGERTVELSGEAYFEVEKNASQPFRVKVRDMEIEVLGTSFNVKAYEDETKCSTSLLKGSIRITRGSETAELKPGEQAAVDFSVTTGPIITRELDEERTLAWMKGLLEFKNDDLRSVMNEISRNYNVTVEFPDKDKMPTTHFSGSFARTDNIRQVLKELEYQHIHTKYASNTIKVVP